MHCPIRKIILIFMSLFTVNCSAGLVESDNSSGDGSIVEAGNPPTPKKRQLVGSVDESDSGCIADAVQAYDIEGTILSATVLTDCRFSMEVGIEKLWGVRLMRDSNVAELLVFDNGNGQSDEYFYYTSDGEEAVDLGTITVSGTFAIPGKEPAKQNDQDGDGTSDYYDTDDDGDGTPDNQD